MKRIVRRGFTLPEVLVTVTIIAVLAAVVVPSVVNQVGKSDKGAFAAETQAITSAITNYVADNRTLPTDFSDLVQINSAPVSSWKGPYLATSEDLSTATSAFTSAAYGITYSPTFATTGCLPANKYVTLTVNNFNGNPLSGLVVSNSAFTQLYKDVTNTTTAPSTTVATGPLQFTVTASAVSNLYVCIPVSS